MKQLSKRLCYFSKEWWILRLESSLSITKLVSFSFVFNFLNLSKRLKFVHNFFVKIEIIFVGEWVKRSPFSKIFS